MSSAGAVRFRLKPLRGGIRARTSIGAVISVALVLAGAAVALVLFLRSSLTHDAERVARIRASSVADLVRDDSLPRTIAISDPEDEFVQVLDSSYEPIASSGNVAASSALIRGLDRPDTFRIAVPFEDEDFLAVATTAPSSDGSVWVIAGQTLENVTEPIETTIAFLIIGLPIVLLLVGAITWQISGRTLSPVSEITSEVRSISSEDLHRRVPVPAADDEIAQLARTMNEMLGRLEESHHRQGRFVSDASHELRSPVAAMRQHLEVALAHPEDASPDLLEVLHAEDLRMQSLIDDLLLLASMEGEAGPSPVDVDLDDLVFAEADRVRGGTRRVDVDTREVSAGRVKGHPRQLTRMIDNLMTNAVRHAGSVMALRLQEADGEVILDVDDDGPGVPPAERRRIFERFVRLDEARARESGGAGLGLAIVHEVVRAHGGRVDVLDSPLGGARFRVVLPQAP